MGSSWSSRGLPWPVPPNIATAAGHGAWELERKGFPAIYLVGVDHQNWSKLVVWAYKHWEFTCFEMDDQTISNVEMYHDLPNHISNSTRVSLQLWWFCHPLNWHRPWRLPIFRGSRLPTLKTGRPDVNWKDHSCNLMSPMFDEGAPGNMSSWLQV